MRHQLVGRAAELDRLDAWATGADAGFLLFQAIGGMGKSAMLWHWADRRAPELDKSWAGILWYSFYEQGADLKDFLIRAVAHVTNAKVENLRKESSTELGTTLWRVLNSQPWLLVLDGLERVLVAYNCPGKDALSDEEAEQAIDGLGLERRGLDCIRPEDDEVLALLAQSRRGKIVASSRLVPSGLTINEKPIVGATIVRLKGLEPDDAARLLQQHGVAGDAERMATYLQQTFACHPLSLGVLPALIGGFMRDVDPARALQRIRDFDLWVDHDEGGLQPGRVASELRGRQTHILAVAFAALDEDDADLLANLALITTDLDPKTIQLLNPKRPPKPPLAGVPSRKTERELYISTQDVEIDTAYGAWRTASDDGERARQQAMLDRFIDADLAEQQERFDAQERWFALAKAADTELPAALERLSECGLVQLDPETGMVDMHPAVRHTVKSQGDRAKRAGIAVGNALESAERLPFEDAQWVGELARGIERLKAFAAGGNLAKAYEIYSTGLSRAMMRLGAYPEALELLQLFFPHPFETVTSDLEADFQSYLLNDAAIALCAIGRVSEALNAQLDSFDLSLQSPKPAGCAIILGNLASSYRDLFRYYDARRTADLSIRLAEAGSYDEQRAWALLRKANLLITANLLDEVETILADLPTARDYWDYEREFSAFLIATRLYLAWRTHSLSAEGIERCLSEIRALNQPNYESSVLEIFGDWHREQGADREAEPRYLDAISLARRMGQSGTANIEAKRARCLIALGRGEDAPRAAERAERGPLPDHATLAELHLDLGNADAAQNHALEGYRQAWGDGPPFCDHWQLERCRKLLVALDVDEPRLPRFEADRYEPLPFAERVEQLIVKARSERVAREIRESESARRGAWLASRTAADAPPAPNRFTADLSDAQWAELRTNLAQPRSGGWHAPPLIPAAWDELAGEAAAQRLAQVSSWLDAAGVEQQLALVRRVDRIRTAPIACTRNRASWSCRATPRTASPA